MRNHALLAMLALSACATAPPPGELPAPEFGACTGEGLGRFVGQPATQALGTDMLRVSGARTIRWVAHGMMVTMDFSPERLTVFLTADGRVERANCG
jgi:hypothetical protein